MKAVLQRVTSASVRVGGDVVGQCGAGLLILICAMPGDTKDTVDALAAKVAKMRLFQDGVGKLNLSLLQTGVGALVGSQFSLAADTSRGNRPGFSGAAKPDEAENLYLQFAEAIAALGVPTETGQFGAEMAVSLVNDGPVTIWLDTQA